MVTDRLGAFTCHQPGALALALRCALWGAGTDSDGQRQGVYRPVRPTAVEVLFDRICRENGIEHLMTQPRSPTTTGKIERFHGKLRVEFDTTQVFRSLKIAQQALDEWVAYYKAARPHQVDRRRDPGEQWLARKVAAIGVICVVYDGWEQVSVPAAPQKAWPSLLRAAPNS